MSNHESNYPGGAVSRLNGKEFTGQAVETIMQIARSGKPKTLDELDQRINGFFQICGRGNLRPGIELLCLALGCTRSTFWHWCKDEGCSPEWGEKCRAARQGIVAFLEQASVCGFLNPATSIFFLKNIAGYKDTISFEDVADAEKLEGKKLTRAEMLSGMDLPMKSRTAAVDTDNDFEA